ncbi:MAG: rhomboid family intramembrane serine protease [Muribaculaceae bacterium]|nr:rhomboid family intramembrane serine protease [Muribaculaceae bacterium]
MATDSSIDYGEDYITVASAGVGIFLIILFELIAFTAGLLSPDLRDLLLLKWIPAAGPFAGLHHNSLPLIGYAFTHAGLLHLLLNMLFFWITGRFLLTLTGRWMTLAVFFSGILTGGLGFYAICFMNHPPHQVVLSGASGGVLAICGTLLALIPSVTVPFRFNISPALSLPVMIITPRMLRYSVLTLVIASLLSGFSPASVATHLTALVAGYLIGYFLKYRPATGTDYKNHPLPDPLISGLFDKIKRSGYDALSHDEKLWLSDHSKKHITHIK